MHWDKPQYQPSILKRSGCFLLWMVALLVFATGPVSAYVINNYNGNPIDWTYQANPMGENYLVNENCPSATGVATAISKAANTWSTAGAKFAFTYGGTTGITNSPDHSTDGINSINWSSNFSIGDATLAVTTYWYDVPSGNISEVDCVFNSNYTWSTDAVTPAGRYDVETVMLHEFGHYLSLGHSIAPAIMQPTIPSGAQRRSLASDDINGIIAIYGPATGGLTLAQALDNTALTFSTGGNANWYPQTAISYYGGSAARSGVIENNQSSRLQTTVTGPGTLSFYWQVSSEATYDFLEFYIDGALQPGRISGAINWQQKTFAIPAGAHPIQWVYVKDDLVADGLDCGWVDKVVFTPTKKSGAGGAILLLLLN
jgi:hypothetical protein